MCLCTGALSVVAFGVGYYANLPSVVYLSSLLALSPLLGGLAPEETSATTGRVPGSVPPALVGPDPEPRPSIAGASVPGPASGFTDDGWFVMSFIPTYDDTNSVGNVYFANYIRYVGKCRELFFTACMPDFDIKTTDFFILTNEIQHKYRREVVEFEPILVRIRIQKHNRRFVTLEHEILSDAGDCIGRGTQRLMFVASSDYSLVDIPPSVIAAFLPHLARTATNANLARLRSSAA